MSTGLTRCGVTMMTSSVSFFWYEVLLKRTPRIGMSPRTGNLATTLTEILLQQARDGEALTVGQFDRSGNPPRRQARHDVARYSHGIREIELGDLRLHFHADLVVVQHRGREVQPNAEGLIIDGDGVAAARP